MIPKEVTLMAQEMQTPDSRKVLNFFYLDAVVLNDAQAAR